ncbi:MAG: purine-binding chemotaxis protein CheW [Desulfobacteraceae bacterium]|nr:purine-binding chemotaxis protein CheW [Desulfobacteraceae bacterium]MCB9494647.1 purine-binding chemotaxis protein CheW [Desulfobacteraceae bacterium]
MAETSSELFKKDSGRISTMTEREGKYLTFFLESEEYGISILKIKEIIGMMPITSVPQTPEFVKGVINLRGKVLPVIDLRQKFGMSEMEYDDKTCIIVVELDMKTSVIYVGIVVDSVSEVLNIKEEDIDDSVSFGVSVNTRFLKGIAKVDNSVKILLDIEKVFDDSEISVLNNQAEMEF